MPKTKGTSATVDKWQRRAAVAQPDYVNGVNNPRTPWDQASKAAEGNYRTAVTQAATEGRFGRGVSRVGNQKWIEGATKKGPSRFVEGVQLGGGNFQERINMVLQTIEGVTLPPRGPKGSPSNYQRVTPIGEALRRAFGKSGGAK
ncbi:MAG TPA: hypothetical protein VGW77_16865 [Candidatus Binatia bacterium]|nr:hypothetical protein [Candidatus Binatia bacterium]